MPLPKILRNTHKNYVFFGGTSASPQLAKCAFFVRTSLCESAGYPSGLWPWIKGQLVNQVGGVITATLLSVGQLDSSCGWWTPLARGFFSALALICALYFLQGHTRQIDFGSKQGCTWTLIIKCVRKRGCVPVCVRACVCASSANLMYSRLSWSPLFTLELALRVNESLWAFYLFN